MWVGTLFRFPRGFTGLNSAVGDLGRCPSDTLSFTWEEPLTLAFLEGYGSS